MDLHRKQYNCGRNLTIMSDDQNSAPEVSSCKPKVKSPFALHDADDSGFSEFGPASEVPDEYRFVRRRSHLDEIPNDTLLWEPPLLGSSTPYQHEESRTDIFTFKYEHTPRVSEQDTEVLEIDLRRKYARLFAHRDESVSSIHVPVSPVSRSIHVDDLSASPMQRNYSSIRTNMKESPMYYQRNTSNPFLENIADIDTSTYKKSNVLINHEELKAPLSYLQSRCSKDFETAKSENTTTAENGSKIDEITHAQNLTYSVAFAVVADTFPNIKSRLGSLPGYINEGKQICSVDFNNNVPAFTSTKFSSSVPVPAAEVLQEPNTVEDAIKSLGFQDRTCKSDESVKEESNLLRYVEKAKLDESDRHAYSDVSEEEQEEIEQLRKATLSDATDTDSPNQTTLVQNFHSPLRTQNDDVKEVPHVKKKARRKMSTPRRSASKKDPKFRGVTMWLQTKFKDGRSKLQISAFYSNIKSRTKSAKYPTSQQGNTSPEMYSCSEAEGNSPHQYVKICTSCRTRRTPLWRDAEDGTPLCNACGIRYKKYRLRCSKCWHIPKKEIKTYPNCPVCGASLSNLLWPEHLTMLSWGFFYQYYRNSVTFCGQCGLRSDSSEHAV